MFPLQILCDILLPILGVLPKNTQDTIILLIYEYYPSKSYLKHYFQLYLHTWMDSSLFSHQDECSKSSFDFFSKSEFFILPSFRESHLIIRFPRPKKHNSNYDFLFNYLIMILNLSFRLFFHSRSIQVRQILLRLASLQHKSYVLLPPTLLF